MKHKVTVTVEVEKKGLFGIKRKVPEKRTIEVDEKTYSTKSVKVRSSVIL